MVVLRHETWTFADSMCSGVAGLESHAFNVRISGPGELRHVYYASTHEEAMQKHYDQQGWGRYKPIPGMTDQPYPAAQLERQLAEYPADEQLKALNGR